MPDERVRSAISHWAPRFTSQGVDYNDFVATTARVERWDQWLDAWSETAAMHVQLATEAEVAGHGLSAGEAYLRAALCYHFGKFVWLEDIDQYRGALDHAIASLYAAHRHLDPGAQRIEIPFEGSLMAANLRTPPGVDDPPLVMVIPGLDSTKEEFFNWENVFLARGMATVSLDGPGQGETGFAMHIRPDYEAPVAVALDHLAATTRLNVEAVGLVGVSLGGYYAPRAAAFEPRVAALAAIAGPYDFGAIWPNLPSLTREKFMFHTGAGDDAAGEKKASELNLSGIARRIEQPMLVVTGKLDRLIPWEDAERLGAEAAQAEVVIYPEGNHVCNNIPFKYRPLVGDWLADHLAR